MKRAVDLIVLLLRWALGLIFIYSGAIKIALPQQFLENILSYQLTGPLLSEVAAIVLPWLELLLGTALLVRLLPVGSSLGVALLGLVFIVFQASAVVRGLSISCGCFGTDGEDMVGKFTLLRTGLIFLAALIVYVHALLRQPESSRIAAAPADTAGAASN